MRKKLFFLVVLLVLVSTFAQAQDLNIYWNPNHNYDTYQDMTSEFEQEHDVDVDLEVYAWPDFRTKIRADFAAGMGPDLIEVPGPWISEFAALGQLKDITELVEDWEESDDWFDITWEETSLNGRIYGIKLHHTVFGLYWNKDLFKEAGLDPNQPPKNLTEFKEMTKVITEKLGPEVKGFGFDGDSQYVMPFMASAEVPYLLDGTEIAIDKPYIIESLNILQEIAKNGWANTPEPGSSYQANRRSFMSGKIAMMLSGPWDINNLADVAPDMEYGITMVPHLEGVEARSLTAGTAIAIPENASNPDLAWEYAKKITSVETEVAATKETGMLMPRETWANDPDVKAIKGVAEFSEILPYGVPFDLPARRLGVSEIAFGGTIFNEFYQNIVYNRYTVEKAMERYIEDASRAIDRATR